MKNSLSTSGVQSVLSSTKPVHSNSLKIFISPSSSFAVGFSLGGWCGSAIERNRFKRQAREIIKFFYLSKQPVHVLVQTKKKLKEIKNAKEEILKILNQSK